VGNFGLSASPAEYRERLRAQSDEQLDTWAAELLRDVAKRRGVARVVADVQKTARLNEDALKRVYARGGGAPAMVGKDSHGQLMLPAISLHCLVSGLRVEMPDARDRLIDYLVLSFGEIVYI
jgi:hypothetical protein